MISEQRIESLEKTVNKLFDILYDHFYLLDKDGKEGEVRTELLKLQNEFNGIRIKMD